MCLSKQKLDMTTFESKEHIVDVEETVDTYLIEDPRPMKKKNPGIL